MDYYRSSRGRDVGNLQMFPATAVLVPPSSSVMATEIAIVSSPLPVGISSRMICVAVNVSDSVSITAELVVPSPHGHHN